MRLPILTQGEIEQNSRIVNDFIEGFLPLIKQQDNNFGLKSMGEYLLENGWEPFKFALH